MKLPVSAFPSQMASDAESVSMSWRHHAMPLTTWRNTNVVITSKRRHFDVITSKWRRFDVITTLVSRNVFAGILRPT